ncbi:hypothetical protein [Streptomyces sp. NPDC047928]|uniref:hypothetical protein n=1 Tax=unclassified Streptomyces TaxID=2593676 RepID=UPI003719B5D7
MNGTLATVPVTPALEPVPVPGCTTCGALAAARGRSRGSHVTVQGLNEQIGNHPHRRGSDREGTQ